MSTGIARAREELFAAHLLGSTGFAAQAAVLAFRAATAAAEAALTALDRVPPPDPAAVVATFVRHVVRERGMDPAVGQRLRSLCNRAAQADVGDAPPAAEGPVAIGDATAVVDAVEDWLQHSEFVTIARSAVAPRTTRRPRP